MLNRLIQRRIEAFERTFGYDASYMKQVLAVSRAAFARLARLQGMSSYREGVSKAAWYAAKLVATMQEDCGSCTQLLTDMALKDGVSKLTVQAVIGGATGAMEEDAQLGFRFARAVLARDQAADPLRAEVVRRFGHAGLVSLAFALASARLYPTLKYALGHGRACAVVRVGGHEQKIQASAAA